MNSNDVALLVQKRQEQFIETRTIIEREVDGFLQSIRTFDEDVRAKCGTAPGNTARDCLPSLWVEPFDKTVYVNELAVLNDYISKVKAVCDGINREALECLRT